MRRNPIEMHHGNVNFRNKVGQVVLRKEQKAAKDRAAKIKRNSDIPFPQSIHNEEWETILHPSIAMMPAENKENNEEDAEKDPSEFEMKVPKFWNPKGFGFQSDVRRYLGNYGERLITPEEAARIGSFTPKTKDYDIKDGDADLEIEYGKNGDVESISYIIEKEDQPPKELEMLETIYVTIASYRDYRCPHTVEALFQQATYPERIRVGVVDQIDKKDKHICGTPERDCKEHPNDTICKYSHLIDTYTMDAKMAVGPVFARHIGDRMYRGEYFAMQSDAHMEFVKNWDVDIIQQWQSAENEMAVLTTYVSNVEKHYDEKKGVSKTETRPYMCYSIFETDYYNEALSYMMHDQQPESKPSITGEPSLSPFWAAGFSFSRGHFAVQVPYDQYLPMIFQGEEISIGIRGFTFGYDFYAPERSILFHYYNHGADGKSSKVKVAKFWEHSDKYEGVERESRARLLGIIEMLGGEEVTIDENEGEGDSAKTKEVGGGKKGAGEEDGSEKEGEETVFIDWNGIDAEKYNTGKVRSVTKFLDTFGIDLGNHTFQDNLCDFVTEDMTTIFTKQLRKDKMGVDYFKIDYPFQDPDKFGTTWEKLM
jgi:[Skp1-protein]-hydroxyproline N-acetylglucosaminyltransferase